MIDTNIVRRTFTFRCGREAPNRFSLAPMTNLQSHEDGTLGDDELKWLVSRARGGFGIVSTCAAYVSDEGKAWRGQLGVAHDHHVNGLSRLADALHGHGVCALVQLHHAGAKATLAPGKRLSTVDADGVRGATTGDLQRVVEDYVSASLRAVEAGFDGVEIHGANGYIFTQFLAPADNPRTDAYGGDLAGRARLIREAMRAVRAAVPQDFVVGVRISPVDLWTERGLRLADSLQVGKWLAEDGADFIHLSLGDAHAPPPNEDTDVPVARAFREALPADVPVMAAGNIWNSYGLAAALGAGVDLPAIGRAAIGNPDWAARVLDADWELSAPPWTFEQLDAATIGDAFKQYLTKFSGLVVPPTES
jgi:2,4-dienoyl-CoA reductase-like NADH-dependent reductase (Old Yellow Enzyme family)